MPEAELPHLEINPEQDYKAMLFFSDDLLDHARKLEPADPKKAFTRGDFWPKFWRDLTFNEERLEDTHASYQADIQKLFATQGPDGEFAKKMEADLGENLADHILRSFGVKTKRQEEEQRKKTEQDHQQREQERKRQEEIRRKAEEVYARRIFEQQWSRLEGRLLKDSSLNSQFGRFSSVMDLIHAAILANPKLSPSVVRAGFAVLIPKAFTTVDEYKKFAIDATAYDNSHYTTKFAQTILIPEDIRKKLSAQAKLGADERVTNPNDLKRIRSIYRKLAIASHPDMREHNLNNRNYYNIFSALIRDINNAHTVLTNKKIIPDKI